MATITGESVYITKGGLEIAERTFIIKIDRTEREVLARDWRGDGSAFVTVEPVALVKIGRTAKKLHPAPVTIWQQKDGSYRESMGATVLNRAGWIVAWNEERFSSLLSQHNGESTYEAAV